MAVRASPKGCKLAHFSFTADPGGGCEVVSRYSAPQGDREQAAKAGNVKASNRDAHGFRILTHKVRRQKWRAHRRQSQQKQLQAVFEAWKRAPTTDCAMATEKVAPEKSAKVTAHATDAALSQEVESPNVNHEAQRLKRPAAWVGATPAKGNQSYSIPERGNGMVTVHTLNAISPELEPILLTPAAAKKQKTYLEAAVYTIGAAVHTPNGTKGTFAGSQSLTPGSTRVTCWMERDGETTTEQLQLKELTFLPP